MLPDGPPRLRHKSHFPLVSNRENADFMPRNHKAIQGDVSAVPIGDDQFAKVAFNPPPYQGMRSQVFNRGLDGRHGALRGMRILGAQRLKRAFDVIERAPRVDYLRHGLGRAAVSSCARRCIHACTSSARYSSPLPSISASAARASLIRLRICSS